MNSNPDPNQPTFSGQPVSQPQSQVPPGPPTDRPANPPTGQRTADLSPVEITQKLNQVKLETDMSLKDGGKSKLSLKLALALLVFVIAIAFLMVIAQNFLIDSSTS